MLFRLLVSLLSWMPDKLYLEIIYRLEMHKKLDLKNPTMFSEKLQWLKLYDHNEKYIRMVDKIEAKDYVCSIIGSDFIIPTLGIWDKVEDIEWGKLPNQFVLKCTHDSGGVVICKDKSKLNREEAIKKLNHNLKSSYFKTLREWPYKNVKRRIIAEEYINPVPGKEDLPDYKFFCFNGEVKALFVATERQNPNEEVKFDFFDADFNPLPFRQGHDHAKTIPLKPINFEKMKKAASELSKGIPHVRVDFYEVGERVLFGELTLFHFSGLVPFEPEEWDYRFGSWLQLPNKKTC